METSYGSRTSACRGDGLPLPADVPAIQLGQVSHLPSWIGRVGVREIGWLGRLLRIDKKTALDEE